MLSSLIIVAWYKVNGYLYNRNTPLLVLQQNVCETTFELTKNLLMKKKLFMLFVAVATMFTFTACEDWFAEEEDDMSSTSTDNTTYTYKWSCFSGGTTYSIQIPNRLSSSCKRAWEFYARTYGCNDANNFAEAERQKRACP